MSQEDNLQEIPVEIPIKKPSMGISGKSAMDELEVARIADGTDVNHALPHGPAFGDGDGPIRIDGFDDGHVPVRGVGAFLARGEDHDIAHLGLVVHGVTHATGGSGPLTAVAEVGPHRQTQLVAAQVGPPGALGESVSIA